MVFIYEMFVSNFINRGFLRLGLTNLSFVQRASSSVAFGNSRMPDKLYKNLELEIRSYEPAVMKSYETFIKTAAQHLNIIVDSVVSKKRPNHNRITLLKSVFVHRKHLVQYEVRTYYTWIQLKHLTGSTADTFLEYVERMLPEGVALKVTKVSLEPLPEHLNKNIMRKNMKVILREKEK